MVLYRYILRQSRVKHFIAGTKKCSILFATEDNYLGRNSLQSFSAIQVFLFCVIGATAQNQSHPCKKSLLVNQKKNGQALPKKNSIEAKLKLWNKLEQWKQDQNFKQNLLILGRPFKCVALFPNTHEHSDYRVTRCVPKLCKWIAFQLSTQTSFDVVINWLSISPPYFLLRSHLSLSWCHFPGFCHQATTFLSLNLHHNLSSAPPGVLWT